MNALAPIRVTRAFVPLLRKARGKVAFVSSLVGSIATSAARYGAGGVPYAMSKAALNMCVELPSIASKE